MQKILVGVDGSPRQMNVLAAASALAKATGARLTLLRTVGLPPVLAPEAYTMDPNEVSKSLVEHARGELEATARAVEPALVDRLQVEVGVAWQTICRVAVEDDVDMIVIGSHGYDTFDKLIGTTAAKVVNHADRTVVVVRAGDRIAR